MADHGLEHLKALHHNLMDLVQHITNVVLQLESTFHEVAHLLDHLVWHLKPQTPSTKECSRCQWQGNSLASTSSSAPCSSCRPPDLASCSIRGHGSPRGCPRSAGTWPNPLSSAWVGGSDALATLVTSTAYPVSTSSTVLEVSAAWEMAPPMGAPIPSSTTTAASSVDPKGGSSTAV